MLHRLPLSALAFALLMKGGLAHAEGNNPAAAEALFDQGRAALAQGDFDAACGRFRESDRLDPAVGTRFNLADCEEKRGRLATAWSLFRGVVAQLADGDDRLPVAQRRLAALEPRVPRLTMVLAPKAPRSMRVKEGDTEYAEGSFGVALPLDPGMHHLTVKAAGYRERDLDVALEAGETAEISVAPGAALPIEAQPAKAPPEADGRRTLGYVLAGVGATGLLVGVVSGMLVLHQKSVYDENCDVGQKVCNQAGKDAAAAGRALSVVSVVGFATGIAASAAGTYFILTNHSGRTLSASGALAPATAFFSLRQTF
ncbi:MAG TPA: hypothetical protein VNW92_06495 [Polyangiaceae bacterium]|jgi:hypothetical protein|nr:hypothetical protein [Polyangiaceae bacterium]